jgi:hypothetical protein
MAVEGQELMGSMASACVLAVVQLVMPSKMKPNDG